MIFISFGMKNINIKICVHTYEYKYMYKIKYRLFFVFAVVVGSRSRWYGDTKLGYNLGRADHIIKQ